MLRRVSDLRLAALTAGALRSCPRTDPCPPDRRLRCFSYLFSGQTPPPRVDSEAHESLIALLSKSGGDIHPALQKIQTFFQVWHFLCGAAGFSCSPVSSPQHRCPKKLISDLCECSHSAAFKWAEQGNWCSVMATLLCFRCGVDKDLLIHLCVSPASTLGCRRGYLLVRDNRNKAATPL